MIQKSKKTLLLHKFSFVNIIRLYLVTILLFLPFQQKIIRIKWLWGSVSKFAGIVDEVTIVALLPVALIMLYRNRHSSERLLFLLFVSLFLMAITCVLSGMFNGNEFRLNILGTFDYVKNFFFIFIYAAFFRKLSEFKVIFHLVLAVAVFIGLIALIQESWAIISLYGFNKSIYDPEIYILRETPKLIEEGWRFGIYRTASLMYNQNMFGLFSLLILTLYLCTKKKINFILFILLLTGIVVSVSKMVYIGFMFLVVLQIIMGRKWFAIFLIPAILIFSSANENIWDSSKIYNSLEINTLTNDQEVSEGVHDSLYRNYAKEKAIEVWKDNPFIGVGPGMFGSPVSVKFNSYVYEEYNFMAMPLLEQIKGLDQFWPQLLAETGIVGTAAFAGIIMSLFLTLYVLRQNNKSFEERGVFSALIMYLLVIIIYGFGSGLNLSAVLVTYYAFMGIALGFNNKSVN